MDEKTRIEMERLAEQYEIHNAASMISDEINNYGTVEYLSKSYKVGFTKATEIERARSAKLVENIKTALQFMSDSCYTQIYLSIEPEYQMYHALEKALAEYQKGLE